MAGIYLHIPFCKQACYYCDFHFTTDASRQDEMVNAMLLELGQRKDILQNPVASIYFGGGTPSLLTNAALETLLSRIHNTFTIQPDAEITLEANPDDLSPGRLRDLRQLGINRLSIGIQSFNDAILKFLNRAHDADAARRCLEESAGAGFTNLSIDLIYAIPGMTLPDWENTLREALLFKPSHLSPYGLTIEDRTVFGNWKKKKKLTPVSDEIGAAQFERMQDILEDAGYDHYEISNFSIPDYHSRHNTSYWMQEHYLGIGPSAHSYDGDRRYFNVRNNAIYVKALSEGRLPIESEVLSRENKINEYLLTRLRTKWGCDLNYLQRAFSDDLLYRQGPLIEQYQEKGLVTLTDGVLRLSRKGKLLADQITEDLMV